MLPSGEKAADITWAAAHSSKQHRMGTARKPHSLKVAAGGAGDNSCNAKLLLSVKCSSTKGSCHAQQPVLHHSHTHTHTLASRQLLLSHPCHLHCLHISAALLQAAYPLTCMWHVSPTTSHLAVVPLEVHHFAAAFIAVTAPLHLPHLHSTKHKQAAAEHSRHCLRPASASTTPAPLCALLCSRAVQWPDQPGNCPERQTGKGPIINKPNNLALLTNLEARSMHIIAGSAAQLTEGGTVLCCAVCPHPP